MMNERVLPSDVETFSLAWENHRETTIYLLFRTGLLCENTFELRQMTFYRIPKVLDRMLGGGVHKESAVVHSRMLQLGFI